MDYQESSRASLLPPMRPVRLLQRGQQVKMGKLEEWEAMHLQARAAPEARVEQVASVEQVAQDMPEALLDLIPEQSLLHTQPLA